MKNVIIYGDVLDNTYYIKVIDKEAFFKFTQTRTNKTERELQESLAILEKSGAIKLRKSDITLINFCDIRRSS